MASPTLPPPPTPTLFDATLPPSAPSPSADSSSPRRRQHPPHHHKQHKHHAADRDPFADLPDASSPLCTACAGPAEEGSDAPPAPDEPSSLFNTLFYTPVAVTSFVLSLTLVDYRNRSYRAAEHVSPSSAPSSRASTWAQRVGGAFAGPEPYRDGYERREGGSGGGDGEKYSRDGERERERWVARKKHRAMAKMELGDAFELRGRVALAVVAAVVLALLAVLWWLKAVLGRLVLRWR